MLTLHFLRTPLDLSCKRTLLVYTALLLLHWPGHPGPKAELSFSLTLQTVFLLLFTVQNANTLFSLEDIGPWVIICASVYVHIDVCAVERIQLQISSFEVDVMHIKRLIFFSIATYAIISMRNNAFKNYIKKFVKNGHE